MDRNGPDRRTYLGLLKMNLLDILKGAATVAGTLHPGIGAAIGLVNSFLPRDKWLPETATGAEVEAAANTLPPAERARVFEHEIELKIAEVKEGNETLRIMLQADAASTHTTRPYIAKHAFHVVALVAVVAISIWGYGVTTKQADLVKAVTGGWPFVAAVIAPFVLLLQSYFGILKQEHRQRLNGGAPSGLGGMISAIIGRK